MSKAGLTRFHGDLEAAVIAGVPLGLGKSSSSMLPGGKADMRKLAVLKDAVAGWVQQGQPLREVAMRDRELPTQYGAALRIFAETGAMDQVLDGLMARGIIRRQLTALLRRTLAYLCLLMGLASVLLVFFSVAVLPSIAEMRHDMQLVPALAAAARTDGTHGLLAIILVFGIAAAIGLVTLLSGGAPRISWWFGGRRMQTHWLSVSAVQIVQLLTAKGLSLGEATALACQLVGDRGPVNQQIGAAVRDRGASADPLKQLSVLASEYRSIAAIQLATLRVVLPIALLCLAGGTVVMIYGVAVFLPIILLLKDLAVPAS